MDFELSVGSILHHAVKFNGDRVVASRLRSGGMHHYTYGDMHGRSAQLANALAAAGIGKGDRVGTIASNSHRHLEAYFAAPAMGAIVHTINPRLFPEQIAFIINDAADRVLLIDPEFVETISRMRDSLPSVERIFVLADDGDDIGAFESYEAIISQYAPAFDWPTVPERDGAALCYTSGTTGNPKGVLYTHRSIVIHALMVSGADSYGLRKRDCVLPIVPMYHVMAWSLPYAAAMNGAKLVLPRADLSAPSLLEMIRSEGVTLAAGVPTIWTDMISHLDEKGGDLGELERIIVGGTAPTPPMIAALEERFNVQTLHGWGMTETSSNGLINTPDEKTAGMEQHARRTFLGKQGRPRYPVDIKIVTSDGVEAPRDGKTFGKLFVAGPTIAGRYFKANAPADAVNEQWLDTGDIATIDERGYVEIVDRDKDIIKSGGEWISSIALENIASAHPDVREAAVISIVHPRWDERPLLVVVAKPGHAPTAADILGYFAGKVAKWWIPDDVAFIDQLPRQATGKVSKADLRVQFANRFSQIA